MAAFWHARTETSALQLVDLRRLVPGVLDVLLREEIASWREHLNWDFSPSAELVQRYVTLRALDGLALMDGETAAGYIYWVSEDRKALLGDLYVRDGYRTDETEDLLLNGAITRLTGGPHFTSAWIRRVEAQLMRSSIRATAVMPGGPRPRGFRRLFMIAPLAASASAPECVFPTGMRLDHFGPIWMEESASLISSVYVQHIDSEINDQYRTSAGAYRFLQNVVQYPGCGIFQPRSSYVLVDAERRVHALSIASRVSPACGHVAQICVDVSWQGMGIGGELLRRTMISLADEGMTEVSLTVTADNGYALSLYERMGFRTIHSFDAMIWNDLAS